MWPDTADRAAYQRAYLAKKRQDPAWRTREHGRQKAYRLKDQEGHLDRVLCWKFGLKPGDYRRMLAAQQNVCAICKRPAEEANQKIGRRLAVDHCHKTGRVRGLLCDLCNRALGQFKEDPDILRSAIHYLECYDHEEQHVLAVLDREEESNGS